MGRKWGGGREGGGKRGMRSENEGQYLSDFMLHNSNLTWGHTRETLQLECCLELHVHVVYMYMYMSC